MPLIQPRRFAECFQIDYVFRGTEDQQQAARDTLTPVFGSPHHQLLQRLDRQINNGVAVDGTLYHKRSYLTVGFRTNMNSPGTPSPAGFNLSAAMGRVGIMEVARHELGHLVDYWLLTEGDREWFRTYMGRDSWAGAFESLAEAVREWLGGGWDALTPILLPD